jgi:hypothetical protein
MTWVKKVLIGLDQLVNAILEGDPDETISSRAFKAKLEGKWWGFVLCKILNVIDTGHCEESVEWDEGESKQEVLKHEKGI